MRKLVNLGILVVLGFVGVCIYWYLNPHSIPQFLRESVPALKLPSPQSPMTNFRPPQF